VEVSIIGGGNIRKPKWITWCKNVKQISSCLL